jgi:hypothetical protein
MFDLSISQSQAMPPIPGAVAMARVKADLESIAATDPDWFADFEDSDPDICPIADLIRLLDTAPNDTARGFLAGKLLMREAIAQITGRPLF